MNKGGAAGACVEHVVRGSPADKGGVRVGDRIVSVDGDKVSEPSEVSRAVAARRTGERISLVLQRGTGTVTTPVLLEARPGGEDILRMDLVGTFAPAWSHTVSLSGAPSSMADLKGKVVLVDFWASWCGPCRMLAPRLSALKEKLGAQGFSVVGITTDPAEKAAVFAEQHKMRYGIVVDESAETSKAYGISSLPTMLLVDKRGVVREVLVGFDPRGEAELEARIRALLAEPADAVAPTTPKSAPDRR